MACKVLAARIILDLEALKGGKDNQTSKCVGAHAANALQERAIPLPG